MDTLTSPTDTQKSTSSLLFCRACQAVYQQPKLLPCLHSFCRPCLVHAVTNGSDGTFIFCPLCSHKSQLPASGVVGVPDNLFLNRMCQEYLTEVQNHLVSRSLNHLNPRRTLELTTSGTDLSSETPVRKYTPLSNFRSQYRAQEVSQPVEDENTAVDQSSSSGQSFNRVSPSGQSTANALEAIRNMSSLQNKVMNLQGEALRVTYAIDEVNQSMVDWHQHKEDLKNAVQRRTTQFQFYLKRMEHQLLAQIDSKQTDDLFYTESDKSKAELRKILNNILHEVSVLKSIQELGKDAEINTLSPILLGRSVGMADVTLNKVHFDLDVPTSTIEEMVSENFGVIRFNSEESKVYIPEVVDFSEISAGTVTQPLTGAANSHGNVEGRETVLKENENADRTLARRSVDRRSRRHNTDLGLDKEDVKEYLAQFQNARENLRARRKEILERGRQASEDASTFRDEIQRRPRSTSRTGRVQSLDRVALPVTSSGRATLASNLTVHEVKSPITVQPDKLSSPLQEGSSHFQYEPNDKLQYELEGNHSIPGLTQEDQAIVSEKLALSTSHQRKLVKQTSDPRYTSELPTSPKEAHSSEMLYSTHSRSLIEELASRRFSNPTSSLFDRRFSDQLNPLFPGENDDLLQYDRTTSRPVRRAISSAADRKAKIEFLRENWQKRKEILIQNEGFVSPDANKQVVKPSPQVQSTETKEAEDSKVLTSETVEGTGQGQPSPPPVSSAAPRFESMHTIRSRVAQYRNELTKVEDKGEQEVKTKAPVSPSTQISEHFSSDLQRQKYSTSQTVASPTLEPPATVSPTNQTIPSANERVSPAIQSVAHDLTNQITSEIPTNQMESQVPTIQTSQRPTNQIPSIPKDQTLSIPPNQVESQTPTNHHIPISATASTNIQEQPSVSTFPIQTTPITPTTTTTLVTTTVTTTPTYSRYSRYQPRQVETIDIASLIAAMYSGNEKKILQSHEQTPETPSTQSTTTQATSITTASAAATGNNSATDSTSTTATRLTSTPSTYSSRYQTENKSQITVEQTENQSQQNMAPKSEETSKPEQESQTRQYRYTGLYSRYNDTGTSNNNTTAVTTTTTTSAISTTTRSFKTSESISTNSSSTEAPTATTSYGNQRVDLKDSASLKQALPMNVTENNNESTPQAEPRPYRYGSYSRYTALSNNPITTASTSISTSITAAENTSSISSTENSVEGSTVTPSKYQTEQLTETTPREHVTSANTSEQSDEPTKQSQLKPSRNRMRSRFTDGVNRRHTIEIGKDAIQSALKLFSKEETTPIRQTTLDPISESPAATHTRAYTPYHNRFQDSSSKVLESTNGTTATLSSSAEFLEANEIKDTIISYKIRASGVTTKIIPTSLEVIQEKSHYDLNQTPKTTTTMAPAHTPPPSPSLLSLSPDEVAQKVRLREIARKKKERWRHMTIH